MNVLFLTLGTINSIENHTIYCDLMRSFLRHGHSVFIVCPGKSDIQISSHYGVKNNCAIACSDVDRIRGGSNMIKKGLLTLMISREYKRTIKKYYSKNKFDLILYSTPPITLNSAIAYIKKRGHARTYLLLKDIFPQNAVDMGIMSNKGIRGIPYKYFRRIEKQLYSLSDHIGCMSPASRSYIMEHNSELDPLKVEICPNSIEVLNETVDEERKCMIRRKYDIPCDKTVFIYGGNIGKPQGVPFIIDCLKLCKDLSKAYFMIVGDGAEYSRLEEYASSSQQSNFKLMKKMPTEEYEELVRSCDVGLIFLDHRFTIPNFPSRLLSYMQARLPVFACTDTATDIGQVIMEGGFGWWCESNDPAKWRERVIDILKGELEDKKENSYRYLVNNYSVDNTYNTIICHFMGETEITK